MNRRSGAVRKIPGPNLKLEIRAGYPAVTLIGVDEVGRGCLAGPVVAGALALPGLVCFKTYPWLSEIADSKMLRPETRERLVPLIEAWVLQEGGSIGIGVASVEEIDEINIFHASHLAMVRAVEWALKGMKSPRSFDQIHAIVDGKFLPKNLPCRATAVIKGDLQCVSIAAASVIAKVWRDRHMVVLDSEYPAYGFAAHKGYSTPSHSSALKKQGPCKHHRRSFAPVSALLSPA